MKNIQEQSAWQISFIEILIGAVLFLVPIWYGSGHLFPFTVTKSLLVIFFAVVMSALFLSWKSSHQTTKLTITPMHGIIGLFGTSTIISALIGINTEFSFFGSLIDGMGLNLVLGSIVIGMITAEVVRRDWGLGRIYLWISLITSMIVAVGAFFAGSFPSTAGGSTFGNTSYMAAYFLINICFAIALIMGSTDRWKKITSGIMGIILLFTPTFFNRLIFTGEVSLGEAIRNPLLFAGVSNGATIALAVTIPIITGFYLLIIGSQKWKKIIGGLLVGSATAGMIGFWVLFQTPNNPINEFFVQKKSNNRLVFWDIAKQGIADRPLFGWGMNNYAYVFQEKFSTDFFLKKNMVEVWTNNPHNMVLEVGVNHGLIGLGLYLAIYIGALWIAIRESLRDKKKAPILIGLAGVLIGYFIQNLFVFDTPGTIFLFWIVIGIIVGYSENWKEFNFSEKFQKIIGIYLKAFTIFLIILLPMLVFKPWKESKSWISYSKFENKEVKENFPQEISRLGYTADSAFVAAKFIEQVQNKMAKDDFSEEKKELFIRILKNFQSNLTQEIEEGVDNFRTRWTLGQLGIVLMILQDETSDELLDQSEKHLEKALEINPNNAYTMSDLVQIFALKDDWGKAREYARKSIEMAPERNQVYLITDLIHKKSPNKEFDTFVREMKEKNRPVE